MIVYTFRPLNGGRSTVVNIDYDPATDTITAANVSGGIPNVNYPDTVPDKNPGDIIYQMQYNGETVTLYWQDNYPFAYSQLVTPPDVIIPVIVIDSIIVIQQSQVGLNDGSATVNVSGGTPPYQYSLDGVVYQNSNVFNMLDAGSYTVFVKSASDPVTQGNFTIEAAIPEPPVVDIAVQDLIALEGAEISIQNAYKRVEVISEFGKVPSLLYNGNFEMWDGQNFNFWTRYGGLDFSRIQRTVKNANGVQIPIINYALLFNKRAVAGKWLEASYIQVAEGDAIKIQYSVGKTLTTNRPTNTYYQFKMRIKVGNYYLFNADSGTDYKWVTDLTFVSNLVQNPTGDLSTYSFNFTAPPCPVNGTLTIQIFGFDHVKKEAILNPDGSVNNTGNLIPLSDYVPVSIDDISVSKTSAKGDNDIDGLLSISENLAYYTEKPDRIEILFGDYFTTGDTAAGFNALYGIKIDNRYSTGWYEYGTTSSPVAFGLSLAKSILRAYQKPFRFWVGSLRLKKQVKEFSYLNVYSFNVPDQRKFNDKLFTFMGGDIDLKYNTVESVKLAEIFDKPAKSNDITVPNLPGSTPPVFVQDPNYDFNNNGIFTDEFTLEFT